jgi:plastocyanin
MRRTTIALLGSAALAAAAVIPASALGGAHAAGVHMVALKNIRFHPASLTIKRGESVKWVWEDGNIEHNVTFHSFHSRTQEKGTYTVRFTRAGIYNYHCSIHVSEGMKGKIVVH